MRHFKIIAAAVLAGMLIVASAGYSAESIESIRSRLAKMSSGLHDLTGTMTITSASRADAKEISKGVLQFVEYGFTEAKVTFKRPDKYRAEGKARDMMVTFVQNGNTKQVIAPDIMLKSTEDLSKKRNKKQNTLDVGFASELLWEDNSLRLVSSSGGLIKLDMRPKGSDTKRHSFIWLDAKSLKLVKREIYSSSGKLKARMTFSGHKTIAGVPIATVMKAYSPDGGFVGSIAYKNLKANTGVKDSLFAIK
jgi:outer membrane lipoprotein-sorting protein